MPKKISTLIRRLVIPPNMARAGWDFDEEIMLDFLDAFGIKWAVKIRYTSGYNTVGCHRAKKDINGNWYHSITISQNRSIENSLHTLLHELRHCMQVESCGCPLKFREQYEKEGASGRRYFESNSFEKDAHAFAHKWAEKWRLLY
jgi:hypothetical protein